MWKFVLSEYTSPWAFSTPKFQRSSGQHPESFLPIESSSDPFLFVDEFRGIVLDISDQIREGNVRFHAEEDVDMVCQSVDGDQLLLLVSHNARNVLAQFLLALPLNKALPTLHREYNLNVDLCVCICHFQSLCGISLLTEFDWH